MAAIATLVISCLAVVGVKCQEDEEVLTAIPGSPGEDYPVFPTTFETSFNCEEKIPGYYADLEGECQQYHICSSDGGSGLLKYSFLCPNGTMFNQQYFICDWWFNVDCSKAEDFYFLNAEILEAMEKANEERLLKGGSAGVEGGASSPQKNGEDGKGKRPSSGNRG